MLMLFPYFERELHGIKQNEQDDSHPCSQPPLLAENGISCLSSAHISAWVGIPQVFKGQSFLPRPLHQLPSAY